MRFRVPIRAAITATAVGLLCVGPQCDASELPKPANLSAGAASDVSGKVYSLRLHHLHTGESLDIVYRIGDRYLPDALDQLNHFLRDHRTEDASHYDPREFDLLHAIMASLGRPDGIIDIVCGYRTPWSNAYLRHGTAASGVAQHSQHMEAKAIDIRVPGVDTARLRDAALSFAAGGVGYYPLSQFVHVDVGPVRQWTFGAPARAENHKNTASPRHRLATPQQRRLSRFPLDAAYRFEATRAVASEAG